MSTHRSYIAFVLASLMSCLNAQPPKPQEGYRWTLNKQYSDEFNGTSLDLTKWYDYHPYWQGRPPARFTRSQVLVSDGMLQLKNKKIEESLPGDTWTIASAAVVSRGITAHFGYYECSQKASKIRMSSTFWMASRSGAGPGPCSGDKYSQELDIQEAVGGATSSFNNSMHSNSHFNYTDCNGIKKNYSVGTHMELNKGEVSDTFHVYAAHWKNSHGADFYLDGIKGNSIVFSTAIDETPFEMPMHINMVTETYDWVTPPLDADLADSTRNTTYIDYVRSWKMIPVDFEESEPGLIENPGFETGNFTYWTGWGGNPREVVSEHAYSGKYAAHIAGPGAPEYVINLRSHASYTLSCYGKIVDGSGPVIFGIKDSDEKALANVQITETLYTKKTIEFSTGSTGTGLKFYFYAPNAGDEGYCDDFSLVWNDPGDTVQQIEIPIFDESVFFDEGPHVLPALNPVQIRLGYQANGDRLIRLRLYNADRLLIGENEYPALAGYGIKRVNLHLDSIPSAGEGYQLVAEILHPDSVSVDPSQTDALTIELQNPVDVTITVVDVRDNLPVEGATVTLNDAAGRSGSDGSILFPGVPPGMISLKVEHEGFDQWNLAAMEVSTDTLMKISLVPETRYVTVILADGYTGDPVPDAVVHVGSMNGMTNHNGASRIPVYAGEFEIEASADKYTTENVQVTIFSDTVLRLEIWRSLADLKFVVKNEGEYLHNAEITIGGKSKITSTIGIAFFSDLNVNTGYTYLINHSDIGMMEDSLILHTDSTLRVNLGTTVLQYPPVETLNLYPNPATDMIHISGQNKVTSYRISNILGTVVQRGEIRGAAAIQISDLENGVYFIRPANGPPLKMIKR